MREDEEYINDLEKIEKMLTERLAQKLVISRRAAKSIQRAITRLLDY